MTPGPFNFTYDGSVTTQQRQWFQDALTRTRFAIDRGGADITVVTVPEPSVPGHNDYMATTIAGTSATIEIRAGADDPTADFLQDALPNPARDVRLFFQEGVIHELAHVFFGVHLGDADSIAALSSMFKRSTVGSTATYGTSDNWSTGEWPLRIEEANAEFFKDIYLPSQQRVFDNRTAWDFSEDRLGEWFDMIESIICP